MKGKKNGHIYLQGFILTPHWKTIALAGSLLTRDDHSVLALEDFYAGCLSWHNTQGVCVSSQDQARDSLLGKCVNHYNTLMEINEVAYLTITVHLIASRHMLFTHFLMWGLPYHEPEWANRQKYGGLELDKRWIIIRQKNGVGVEYWAKVEWDKVDVCRSGQVDSCADQWRNLNWTEQRIQIVANWAEQVTRESKGAANVNWTGFSRAEEVKGCR